jgi:hypothetical protein
LEKEKIKPVGYIKTTKTCKGHIPELIRREVNAAPGDQIPFVINARTVLLYDPDLSLESLLASIDVLKRDVALRVQKETVFEKQEKPEAT